MLCAINPSDGGCAQRSLGIGREGMAHIALESGGIIIL